MSGVVLVMRIQCLCLTGLLSKKERQKRLQRKSTREMILRQREQQQQPQSEPRQVDLVVAFV